MKISKLSVSFILLFNVLSSYNFSYSNEINSYINSDINSKAYNYYKKGLELYSLHTIKDYKDSIDLFNKALEISSNFYQALASKSLAQSFLAYRLRQNEMKYNDLFALANINAEKSIKLNNNLPDAYIALSAYYKFNYNEEKAQEFANKALSLSPNNPDAYFWIWYSSNNKNPDDENIKKVITLNPNMLIAYSELGNAYFRYSKYDEALLEYQKAISINPKYVYAYNNIASVYGRNNDYESALSYYKKALELSPSDIEVIKNLNYMYVNQKYKSIKPIEKNFILQVLKNALIINPDSYTILGNIDNLIVSLEDKEKIQFYKEILEKTNNSNISLKIAEFYLEQKNYKEAISFYKKIEKTNPQILENNFDLLFIYYQIEDYDNFFAYLANYNYHDEEFVKNVKLAKTHIYIGDYFYNYNKDFSLVAYKRALKLDNKNPEIYIKIANAINKDNSDEEPISYIEKALELSPNNHDYINLLAEKYYINEQYYKSIELYKKALSLKPDNIDTLISISRSYLSIKDEIEEIKYLKRILTIDKYSYFANRRMGEYYEYKKDYENSLIYYKSLLNSDSYNRGDYKKIISLYEKLGKKDEVNEYLFQESVSELKYRAYFGYKSADSFFNLFNAYRLAGKTEDAIRELNQVLKIEPKHIQANFALAEFYKERAKNLTDNSYILPFKKSYSKNSKSIDNIINLGNAYMKISDLDNAEKMYNEALNINESPKIYNLLSDLYKIRSDEQLKKSLRLENLKEYKNLIENSPYNHNEFYNLALDLKNKGNINNSIYGIEEAIRINPYNSEYHLQLANLYKELNNDLNYKKELKLACSLASVEACNILNKK